MTGAEQSLNALRAFGLPLEGGRLLLRERRLWGPALGPLLLSLGAFSAAIALLVAYAAALYAWATGWLPELEAARWYAWLWVGPARAALWTLGALLFAGIAGVMLVLTYLVVNVLASPFHDVLSYRIELLVTGEVREETSPGVRGVVRDALRALVEELRRTAFFVAVVVGLGAAGLLIPGAQIVTGPTLMVFSIFFLPLDYASYTLDRRRLSFREKRRWLLADASVVGAFGVAAFLTCALPGVNLVAMPLLVAGGTLLALRHDPDRALRRVEPAPGAGPGTPPWP